MDSAFNDVINFAKSFLGGNTPQAPVPQTFPQPQPTQAPAPQPQQSAQPSFFDSLVQDWNQFVQRGQQGAQNVNQPYTFDKFAQSPGGQAIMGLQQKMQDVEQNAPFQIDNQTPVLGGITRVPVAGDLVRGMANTPGQYIQGIAREGQALGDRLNGQITPQQFAQQSIGNIAEAAQLPLLLAGGGAGAEVLGAKGLTGKVLSGALTGAKYGGMFGALGGLQQGENAPDIQSQLGQGVVSGLENAPFGAAVGAGIALGGPVVGGLLGKGLQALKGKIGEAALRGNILARLTPDYLTQKGQDIINGALTKATQLKPQFDLTMQNIAQSVGLNSNDFESRIKDPSTFLQKIAKHRLDGDGKYDARDVNDIYGGRFITNNPVQKQAIIDQLHDAEKSGALKITHEEQVNDGTYHAYHIDINSNGINGEIQIHDPNSLLESVKNHEIRSQYGDNPPPEVQAVKEENADQARNTPPSMAQDEAQSLELQKRIEKQSQPSPIGTPQLAQQIYKATVKNGGITIDTKGGVPEKGYAYAPSKGTEMVVPSAQFNENTILDFMAKNKDLLSQPGNHVGTWVSDGNTYLDISRVGETSPKTLEDAQTGSQLAVYDLEHGNEIPIGKLENGVYNKLDEAANIYNQYQGQISRAGGEGGLSGASEVPEGQPTTTAVGEPATGTTGKSPEVTPSKIDLGTGTLNEDEAQFMREEIARLNNKPGGPTPEDLATLKNLIVQKENPEQPITEGIKADKGASQEIMSEEAPFGIEALKPTSQAPSAQLAPEEKGPGPLPFGDESVKGKDTEMPIEREFARQKEEAKPAPAQEIRTDKSTLEKASMEGGMGDPQNMPAKNVVSAIIGWMRGRVESNTEGRMAQRKFAHLDSYGLQGILDYQKNPKANPDFIAVKKHLDALFKAEKEAGVGGKDFTYKQNYLTGLWQNSADQVRAVFGDKISANPSFTQESLFKNYEEGIKKGLTPRFTTISQIVNWRSARSARAIADANFISFLQKNNLVQPFGKVRGLGWKPLDPQHFPMFSVQTPEGRYSGVFGAPAPVADIINNHLSRPDEMGTDLPAGAGMGRQIVAAIPKVSSGVKQVVMSTGIPYTGFDVHLATVLPRFAFSAQTIDTPILKYFVNPPLALGKALLTAAAPYSRLGKGWLESNLDVVKDAQMGGYAPKIENTVMHALPREGEKNIWTNARDFMDTMFTKPMFEYTINTLALRDVYAPMKAQLMKGGMEEQMARETAAKFANEVAGNPNIEEMFRSKQFQQGFQVAAFSPKLLESNLRLGQGIWNGITNPKDPAYAPYRYFATTFMGSYALANLLNHQLSGHFMFENDPGHKFQLEMGYTADGQKRYFNAFGSAVDFVKIPVDAASAIWNMAHGDTEAGRQLWAVVGNKMGSLSSLFIRLTSGANAFGQPLAPAGSNPLVVGANLLGQISPQSINSLVGYATGNKGGEQALTQGLGLPFRYSGGPTTQQIVLKGQAQGKSPQEIQSQVNSMYANAKYVSSLAADNQTLVKGYYAANATYQTAVTTPDGNAKIFPATVQGAMDAKDYSLQNGGKVTSVVDQKQGFSTHTADQMGQLADHFDKLYPLLKADPKNVNDPLFNGMTVDQAKAYVKWSTLSGLDKAKFEEQNLGVLDGKRMMNDYEKQVAQQNGLTPYPDDPIWNGRYTNQDRADYHMFENMTTGSEKSQWAANHPNVMEIRIDRQPYLNQITQLSWDNRSPGQSPAEFMKANPYSNFAGVDASGQVIPAYNLLDDPYYKLPAPMRQIAQTYTAYSQAGGAVNKAKAKELLAQNSWLKDYWNLRSQYYAGLPSGNTNDYGSPGLGIQFTYGNTGTGGFGGGTTASGLTDRYIMQRAMALAMRNPNYPQIEPMQERGRAGILGLKQNLAQQKGIPPSRLATKPLSMNLGGGRGEAIPSGQALSAQVQLPRVKFEMKRPIATRLSELGGTS